MEDNKFGRAPRTLTDRSNSGLIKKLYESGGSVALDLIIYLANHQLKNLFGESWFSIKDFCDTMNYERTKLHRKLTQKQIEEMFGKQLPEYMKTDPDGTQIVHQIENKFEAAIYWLGKTNLTVPFQNADGSTSFNFVQIISKFDIKTNFKTKKDTKRLYSVTLNPAIRDSVFSQYDLVDLADYRSLPDRTGYRFFYLNLAKMICVIKYRRKTAGQPFFTFTVNELAKVFNIQSKRNDHRKSKVKEILDSINELLVNTKFEYCFIKSEGQKWAYTVQFHFKQETLDFFDEKFKAVFTKKYYEDMLWEYTGLAYPNIPIGNGMGSRKSKKEEIMANPDLYKDFIDWMHSEQNLSLKLNRFTDIFVSVFEKTPQELGVTPFNLIDNFPYEK